MLDSAVESYPIRTVSEITGVNSVTLRAWERRYGLIKPSRTPKGHRLYTREDIQMIQEILDRLGQGMSISQITHEVLERASQENGQRPDVWALYMERMIEAIQSFNEQGLETVYNDAMSLYPVDIVTTRLILPLMKELGERWEQSQGSIAEEHFFSVYLRNKLGARFHHQNLKNTGPRLVAACLPSEHHEFGILLFALMAHSRGYQIILLGANLPVAELGHVVAKTRVDGIVLAGSASLSCEVLIDEIRRLTDQTHTPVFIGGDVAYHCRNEIDEAGAVPLGRDLAGSMHQIAMRLERPSR